MALGQGPLLSCRGLNFSYPGSDRKALNGLSLDIFRGEYVGVVGANGSGKSTLARILNGLLKPDSGEVRVLGFDPAEHPWEVRGGVGVLFQNPDNQLVAPFVEDDVAFGLENLGISRPQMRMRVRKALEAVGLTGFERREPHTLSGGEKQRTALAGILAMEPEVLVLDEPTSLLDPEGRREVLQRVRTLGEERTVIHITHHLDEILTADRVLLLSAGELTDDVSPLELISAPMLLKHNRLLLPPVLRMGLALGAGVQRTPEELARVLAKQKTR